jgi:hypothetical protein
VAAAGVPHVFPAAHARGAFHGAANSAAR